MEKRICVQQGGKIGGKNQFKYNIQDPDTNDIQWYDFNEQEWLPITAEVLVTNTDKESKLAAKLKELGSWKQNDVYIEVPNENQHAISTRWVMSTKELQGNMVAKARLVARGFEDTDHSQCTDSPTCSKDSIRMALALMASRSWDCMTLDVKTAFLQGSHLKRDIFLLPPKEANTNGLWKLNKAVYGLREASRKWYDRVKIELEAIGMVKSKYDEALFYWNNGDACQGIIAIHVDDFFVWRK
jgi:hypothetical protein